ncbi:MAG: SEL1-like repeat protein [Rhodanobacteraceae bacterium]|nr:SEL1-like repeat protein [Rhodanobacteraceae bacterium]
MNALRTSISVLVAGLALVGSASAQVFEPRKIDPNIWQSAHFQRAHPDLKYRVQGQNLLQDGRVRAALAAFGEAARWGDKLSQAMVAEIYWEGQGVQADRARAYAWMDLAAERQFLAFVAKREKYWAQLNAEERDEALAIGAQLYADYGDDVALPRLDKRISSEREPTGSRAGFSGSGQVVMPEKGGSFLTLSIVGVRPALFGGVQVPLYAYYAPQLWRIDQYVKWQADELEIARRGVVRVGAVDEAG